MPSLIRSVVTFPAASGLPEDAYVNVWHHSLDVGPVEASDLSTIATRLGTFYGGDPTGDPTPIASYMPDAALGAGQVAVDHYEVDIPTGITGSPIGYSELLGVPALYGSGQSLPTEVSLCLSFHGDLTDLPEETTLGTRPASRHRGRVFLGPLSVDALTAGRPQAFLMQSIMAQAEQLMDGTADPDPNIHWVTYSRTSTAFYLVTGGWVDNAFDTQRRRGPAATSRLVFA